MKLKIFSLIVVLLCVGKSQSAKKNTLVTFQDEKGLKQTLKTNPKLLILFSKSSNSILNLTRIYKII